jgi:hypothetical protein
MNSINTLLSNIQKILEEHKESFFSKDDVTFSKEITNWLKECILIKPLISNNSETKEIFELIPFLLVAIKQYIIVLENMARKEKIKAEIKKNLRSAFEIHKIYLETRNEAVREFYSEIAKNSEFTVSHENQFLKNTSLFIKLKTSDSYFIVELADQRNDFYFGIWTDNPDNFESFADRHGYTRLRHKNLQYLKKFNTSKLFSKLKNGIDLIQVFQNDTIIKLEEKFKNEFDKVFEANFKGLDINDPFCAPHIHI